MVSPDGQAEPDGFDDLIAAVTRWAAPRPDIVGVGIVGSHARGTARPGSDIDFVLVAEDPAVLEGDPRWPARFGKLRSMVREDHGLVRSLRCRYANGPEVEFGLTGRPWCVPPIDPGTASVIRGGLRVLHDPEALLRPAEEWVASAPTGQDRHYRGRVAASRAELRRSRRPGAATSASEG